MIASFRAEVRKLRHRPAVWVLGGILLVLVVTFGYAVEWIQYATASASFRSGGLTAAQLKEGLYPAAFVKVIANGGVSTLGPALVVVLGALAVGSEYGWGTLKTVFSQRPGRIQVLVGQFAALTLIVGVLAIAIYAVAAASSLVIVLLDSKAIVWPAAIDILKGLGATWLVFEGWTLFGAMLAYLFRQSALAIGLGLAYMLIIEGLVFGLLGGFNLSWLNTVEKFFIGQNATALRESFGQAVTAARGGGTTVSSTPLVGAGQAVIVLAVYGLFFIAASMFVVRRRDVT
ncbi:MAG: ABC transporter permease subunit [Actinomycetota bacterium]|nr:ABC transporter permease subunit [Candidatus Dormibacteraeota bacterium]MDQ6947535.1 ABC transporter permease subunit [Actinomycetota bacterium]